MVRRARELTLVGLMVLGLLAAAPIPALAGSNGQQINVQDNRGDVYSVCIDGQNQSGAHVRACFSTPSYNNWINNYWWRGWTLIDEYGASGNYIQTVGTYVPTSQSSDWWCVDDRNGAGTAC